MSEAFPTRMKFPAGNILEAMYQGQRLGQKNGKGFYDYTPDKKGKPKKTVSQDALALISKMQTSGGKDFDDATIINRLMIPMINECVLCLQEGIVETPMELDLALIYGLGFPPFRGGAIRYLEQTGLEKFVTQCNQLESLGAEYKAPEWTVTRAKEKKLFYPTM